MRVSRPRVGRLPFRTWGPYWVAGVLWSICLRTLGIFWPDNLPVAALVASGAAPVALVWLAHRVEQHYRLAKLKN